MWVAVDASVGTRGLARLLASLGPEPAEVVVVTQADAPSAWAGLAAAFDAGVVPLDGKVLVLHAACVAGPRTRELAAGLSAAGMDDADLLFVCDDARGPCIANRAAVAAAIRPANPSGDERGRVRVRHWPQPAIRRAGATYYPSVDVLDFRP